MYAVSKDFPVLEDNAETWLENLCEALIVPKHRSEVMHLSTYNRIWRTIKVIKWIVVVFYLRYFNTCDIFNVIDFEKNTAFRFFNFVHLLFLTRVYWNISNVVFTMMHSFMVKTLYVVVVYAKTVEINRFYSVKTKDKQIVFLAKLDCQ